MPPVATKDLDDFVTTRLRSADQRYTRGRRGIIDALLAGGGPMTIPQILDDNPHLAQSSVYRNLAVLEEVGVVTRIVTRDDFARYELAEDLTEHHHHLICSACGEVSDFSLQPAIEAALDDALNDIARRSAFTVEGHRLDLVGVCTDCA